MKSVKPGRGPSAMNAMSSVIAVVFGIFWTAMAASMGAPIFFPLIGVLFVIMGIVQAIYHVKNATGENRFSEFDITDSSEESDPLQKIVRKTKDDESGEDNGVVGDAMNFCPYCGTRANSDFEFCKNCGKKLQ